MNSLGGRFFTVSISPIMFLVRMKAERTKKKATACYPEYESVISTGLFSLEQWLRMTLEHANARRPVKGSSFCFLVDI